MLAQNVSLKPYNSFGIDATAKFFGVFNDQDSLQYLLEQTTEKRLILGGGSNILLLNDYDGTVLKNEMKGIKVVQETNDHVIVEAGSGELWHSFVLHCIENNWAGIENLSLIPGTVGAAPMQNIGAYGVELKDVFHSLTAFNIKKKETQVFDKERCKFGYRESFFKHEGKDLYVILSVRFELHKNPKFNTSYGVIKETMKEMGIKETSIKAISEAVIKIRRSKLPDPAEIGNAGSFFKNPEISITQFDHLKKEYPTLPSYKVNKKLVKVPAGWLIEQAGWKGYQRESIGVHKNQALVLVNYGGGLGKEIKDLALEIQESVLLKFGIKIFPEVNFIS